MQFDFNLAAPTYETATTRKYRQGRTETLRSCSNEAVAFIRHMDKNETDISTKRQLLKTALVHFHLFHFLIHQTKAVIFN